MAGWGDQRSELKVYSLLFIVFVCGFSLHQKSHPVFRMALKEIVS